MVAIASYTPFYLSLSLCLSLSGSLSLSLTSKRLIRGGVVVVAAAKKNEWVLERVSLKDTFYRDWGKMQQILKAGYPKPVSVAMNGDIKVGTK